MKARRSLLRALFAGALLMTSAYSVQGAVAAAPHSDHGLHKEPMRFGEDPPDIAKWAADKSVPAWAPLPMFVTDTQALPALKPATLSKSPADRARAAFLIGQIGGRNAISMLAPMLKDKDANVRLHSGLALALQGDRRGLSACAETLANRPTWLRYYAIYGLWRVNTTQSRQALKKASPRQPAFIKSIITSALSARPSKRSAAKLPKGLAGVTAKSKPSMPRIWESVSDQYAKEADFWWHRGRYEQSIRCMCAGLLFLPGDAERVSSTAWLQWNQGRPSEGLATLKAGVAAAPRSPGMHYELGQYYVRDRRYALAEKPFHDAVSLGGDHLAVRSYAHCLEKNGKLTEALAQWSNLVKARPNDATVKRNHDRVAALIANQTK